MRESENTKYVVLADVIDSRKIENRREFESTLIDAFDFVNDSERESISTPFTQMKGIDEFGCVLTELSPLPDILSAILDRIHPSSARFAIAGGDIDIGADCETVAQMDGPAFHLASALLDEVEENELYVGVDTGTECDGLVSSALNLLLLERENLTDRQVEVILAYERHGTQSKAGEELGLQQQAVSNALHRSNYTRRLRIRGTLRKALTAIYD
ncbi:SatD family protein [Halorussus salilacus]|uniref:SatD family protein n=1 Tax=Halorussus salilacus TaxID=2953750 RepID=UPI00209FECF2|nr:SatD family protein [Halorussus salilacus]USZ66765.1 SatD family protein [Halorussus salilacus]